MKKLIMLALAAVSALLVGPTFASANPPLHVSATGAFTVHGGSLELARTSGGSTAGKMVTGSGTFETTTTGTVTLTFSGVESDFGSCENIKSTKLPFHLTTLDGGGPGILITTLNGHFATFKCGLFGEIKVAGNGILGTITSPGCGGSSTTAKLSFKPSSPGHQVHGTLTGTSYGLTWAIGGGASPLSISAETTITFPASRTLTCT